MSHLPPIPRPIGVLVLVLSALCAAAAAQQEPSYRIGPRDKVEVRVLEIPELARDFQVAEDGELELPNVGKVEAAGLTERELAEELRRLLEATGLRRATVSVRITEFSRPVAVLGAVSEPGNRSLAGRASLLDVLLMAGGLTSDRGEVIRVQRRAANGLSDQVDIGVDELFELADPAVNIPIFAGDVIHALPAQVVRVSFLGEVNRTGNVTFRSTERVTLLVAIAQAGGLSESASNKIRILRGRGDQKIEITANYRNILKGKDPDVELEDGDIVVVKEAFF